MAKKKKNYSLPDYLPSKQENEAYRYCVRNDIRISYKGIQNDPDHWYIEVRLGPYIKGEKAHISPEIYDRKTISSAYYEMCKYYYDKRTR